MIVYLKEGYDREGPGMFQSIEQPLIVNSCIHSIYHIKGANVDFHSLGNMCKFLD